MVRKPSPYEGPERIVTLSTTAFNRDLWVDKLRLSYPVVKGLQEI